MTLPPWVAVPLSCVLWLCFAAVIAVLVLSLLENHYIKWWFHTYSPPHDTNFEGKYHLKNDAGEHELELLHSGQVEMTSTKEGHVTKRDLAPVYWVNKHEGKIVSDGMEFGKPQLIKLQYKGNSKTIEWFLAPDETVANVDQSRVMIGYRKPIDVLEYSGKVDLPPGQDKTIDIYNSELRDISVKVKVHSTGARVTYIDKERPTVFTEADGIQ